MKNQSPHRWSGTTTESPLKNRSGNLYLDTAPPYLDDLSFGTGVCPWFDGDLCSWPHWRFLSGCVEGISCYWDSRTDSV